MTRDAWDFGMEVATVKDKGEGGVGRQIAGRGGRADCEVIVGI